MNATSIPGRALVRTYQAYQRVYDEAALEGIDEGDRGRAAAALEEQALDEALSLPRGSWRRDVDADTAATLRFPGQSVVNVATPCV